MKIRSKRQKWSKKGGRNRKYQNRTENCQKSTAFYMEKFQKDPWDKQKGVLPPYKVQNHRLKVFTPTPPVISNIITSFYTANLREKMSKMSIFSVAIQGKLFTFPTANLREKTSKKGQKQWFLMKNRDFQTLFLIDFYVIILKLLILFFNWCIYFIHINNNLKTIIIS